MSNGADGINLLTSPESRFNVHAAHTAKPTYYYCSRLYVVIPTQQAGTHTHSQTSTAPIKLEQVSPKKFQYNTNASSGKREPDQTAEFSATAHIVKAMTNQLKQIKNVTFIIL